MTGSPRSAEPDRGIAGRRGAGACLALALAAGLVFATGARAEDVDVPYSSAYDSAFRARAEGLPIRRVDVVCRDIYEPVPPGRFAGLYRVANRLHVRTRPSTVRSQLLFGPGDRWSADRMLETQRILRDFEFLEPDTVRSRIVGDSVDVLVGTRDQWTTQPEVNLERGGGRTYGSIGFTEQNLLGLGVGLEFVFREEPTGHTHSAEISARRILGTQLEGRFKAGTGTGGVTNTVLLRDPYRSLDDDRAWTTGLWRSSVDQMLFRDGQLSAKFPFESKQVALEWGTGERRSDGVVRRFTAAFGLQDRHYGPTRPEPGEPDLFAGGEEDLDLRWLSGRITLWRPRFIERRGIEYFDPIEDYDVGRLVSFESGLILRALGSTANEGLVRLRLEGGHVTRRFGFGMARARVSSRVRGGPRETLAHLDARWVQQPARDVAIVFAALGQAADRAPREVQYVVGGLNGLRAYPVQELAGTQVWRFNAETRWVAARNVWDVTSVGGAVFLDSARAWGTAGAPEPWHLDAGFGLRLSFPHASLHQVARLDVAFPLSPTRDGRRSPVFSFGSSQAF